MKTNVENTSSIIQSLTRQSKIAALLFLIRRIHSHIEVNAVFPFSRVLWMNKYLSMLNLREIHNYVFITRSLNVTYKFTYCCVYSSYSVQTCSLVQSRIKYLQTVFNLWINEHFGYQSGVYVLILRFCYRPNTLK